MEDKNDEVRSMAKRMENSVAEAKDAKAISAKLSAKLAAKLDEELRRHLSASLILTLTLTTFRSRRRIR